MYLMYVDESGDVGLFKSPTRYFVLSGLVTHELRWESIRQQLINFRLRMRQNFGLKLREEIHASAMVNKPGELVRLRLSERITVLRFFADELASINDLNVINVVVDKSGKHSDYDPFVMAWRVLLQRFENTMARRNFTGPANADERGMVLSDHTDDKRLISLTRQLRRYNPIPNQAQFGDGFRNLTLMKLIEDPVFKDSRHSYFLQACDLIAYLLYQKLSPNAQMRKRAGQKYFDRLDPILCKVASNSDVQGIVRL